MKKIKNLLVVILTIAMLSNTVSSVSVAAEYNAKDAAIVEDTSEQTSGDQTDEGSGENENSDETGVEQNTEDTETNEDSEDAEDESESGDSEENQDSEESGEDTSDEETEEEQDSEESEEAEENEADETAEDDAPEVINVEEETVGAKSSRTAYVKGVSLNLSGKIGIKIYLDCTEVLDGTNDSQKLIDINGETVELGSLETGDGISNMPIFYELSAKEMNKEVSIKLYDWNGDIIILKNQNKVDDYGDMVEYEDDTFVFKIKDYIDDVSVSSEVSDTLRSLMYFMEVYGQKAQQYFDYDLASITEEISATEIPVEKLKNFVKTTTPQNATLPAGLKYYGSSLLLESEITIRHYFSLTGNKGIEDYRFNLKHTDADGTTFYEELSPGCKGSLYYIDVENIPAPKIGEAYSLIVTDDNGGNAWTLNYSAMSYVYDAVNSGRASEKMMNLCKSLYWYYISAADYFGLTNPEDGSGIGLKKGTEEDDDDGNIKTKQELLAEAKELIELTKYTGGTDLATRMQGDSDLVYLDGDYWRKWLSFEKEALKTTALYEKTVLYQQDNGSGGVKEYENDIEISVYNTDGTMNGIYLYYGEYTGVMRNSTYVDPWDTKSGFKKWYWVRVRQADNTGCTIDFCDDEYIVEMYYGGWKADKPGGTGDYYIAKMHCDRDEVTYVEGGMTITEKPFQAEMYDYRATESSGGDSGSHLDGGVMNGNTFHIYYGEFSSRYGWDNCEGVAPTVYTHHFNINFNQGKIVSCTNLISEENGIVKCKCTKDGCTKHLKLDKNALYKVSGIDTNSVIYNNTGAPSEFWRPDDRKEILTAAYELVADIEAGIEIDYEKWANFTQYVRGLGIVHNSKERIYVMGDLEEGFKRNTKGIAVYCGYQSDDIYIYYGDIEFYDDIGDGYNHLLGRRNGSGKWITVKSLCRTEYDTGYKDEAKYYEVTNAQWVNDFPTGEFTTDIHMEVLTSTKAVITDKTISGNMEDGKYNGDISWTTKQNIKYLYLEDEGNINSENSYSAAFNMGNLNADNVDNEGYAFVYALNNPNAYDRVYTGRKHGLSGWDLAGSAVDNTIIQRLNESEVTPDSSAATLNTVFDMAKKLATQNSENWEWWSTLKTKARAYGITYDSPAISSVLDNGKYIGVYGAYDGKGYYIYYGDMYEGVRTGQGRWISATSYTTTSNTATGKYLEDYSGGWSNNRPEGSFRQSNTLWVSKNGKTTKVARTYTGNVTDGAFNGIISWDVDTSVTQNNNTLSHTVHSFRANFEHGFIMGYKPDTDKYVYVPSLYSVYTEEQIHSLKQYIVGGLPSTDNAIVSGNKVFLKIVRTNAATGRVTIKYEEVNY